MQMGVAKELGYTLTKLKEEMTFAELLLWVAYFENIRDAEQKAIREAQRR